MKIQSKKSVIIRQGVQAFVFVLVLLIAVSKWLSQKGISIPFFPSVSLHAVCPFGGVVTIYEFVTTGQFIQKIHSSAFIMMLLGLLVAVLFGTVFCGYLCPFGTFQEWLGMVGKKLFPQKYNHIIPKRVDRVLRYLRYAVLAMVVYQTAVTAKLVFQSVDPYYALFNFFTDEVALSAYITLGVIMLLSLFIERPWCKYFCPYGAVLGLFNAVRIFKIRRDPVTCVQCRKCDQVCPMNIAVSGKQIISDPQCISCHKCTSEAFCPVDNTVTITAGKVGATHEN